MNRQISLTTNFKGSLEGLSLTANQTAELLDRDQEMFGNYGITETQIGNFNTVLSDFKEIKRDDVYLGLQVYATEQKTIARENLIAGIRDIMLLVENAFSSKSVIYNQFRNGRLSDMSDGDLCSRAKVTVDILNQWFEVLNENSLNQSHIDNLEKLYVELQTKIIEQAKAINDRNYWTEQRILKANELYALITKYSSIGRKMWTGRNEAYSNDYILYGSVSQTINSEEESPEEFIDTGGDEFYPDNG